MQPIFFQVINDEGTTISIWQSYDNIQKEKFDELCRDFDDSEGLQELNAFQKFMAQNGYKVERVFTHKIYL